MRRDTKDETRASYSNGNLGDSSSSRFSSLLASPHRDFLLSPSGAQVKISEIEGKVVGLLFAANWYAPCRRFIETLIAIYNELKSTNTTITTNLTPFEIVYVSSDEDSDAFHTYYASMPFLAVPFFDLETKKALTKKYDVEAIPCLVILQPHQGHDGNNNNTKDDDDDDATVLRNGVELIYRYGVQAYPFSKARLEQLQKEEREKHEKQTLVNLLTNHQRDYVLGQPGFKRVPVSSLVGKTIGLYFSAGWCVPCLNFTPKLISIYHKIKNNIVEEFEIVLVSSDRDVACFESYFGGMPWLALPFGDPEVKRLARYFDVEGIPCLVILGPDGKTITRQGRNLINLYKENAYPFTDSKVELLEKELEEAAKELPVLVWHEGHRHGLNLVSEGNGGGPFICCACDEQGSSWAYQCLDCGYQVHPKCVRAIHDHDTMSLPS